MTAKSGKSVKLQAVAMINLAMGWMETYTVPSSQVDLVSNQVELAELTRYPLPSKVIVDIGNEFLPKFREMVTND